MECWLLCMLNAYTFYTAFIIDYWLLLLYSINSTVARWLSIYHSAAKWWIGWETLVRKFVLIWWGVLSFSVFRRLTEWQTWIRNYNFYCAYQYKIHSLTLICLNLFFEIMQTLLDSAKLSNINSILRNWDSMLVIYMAD